MFNRIALASCSLIALAAPAIAQNQTASANDQSGLSDIIVTATRQATNNQDTPISITAVTAETLEARGLTSTADLSDVVPNATFRRVQGAFGPGISAFIRGIGQGDTSLGSEPSVAYYIDDIYYPIIIGSNFDLLDLDHVEVLRGPQGTLFGRNALAGAVNIVSKTPSLKDSSAYTQVTTGSFKRIDIRAGFTVPLIEDVLGVSVSGVMKSREGYQKLLDFRCEMIRQGTPALAGKLPFVDNINTPAANFSPSDCTVGHMGGEDVKGLRGSILWEPTSNVRLTINSDWIRDRSENPADTLVAVVGTGANNVIAESNYFGVPLDSRFVTGDPYKSYATYSDPVGSGTVIPAYAAGAAYAGSPASAASTFHNNFAPQRGGARFPNHYSVDNWGVSGKLVVGITDAIDLTAIAGYRKVKDIHAFDIDNSPLVVEQTLLHIGEDYRNGELRLSGKSKYVDWVAGLFYFEGDGYTHAINYSPQSGFYRVQNINYQPKSKAAFANVIVHPIDRLNITLGGRYSDDGKFVDFTNLTDVNLSNIIFQVHPKATRFDWKAGADYHFTDDVMVFASAATGARLPGYNPRPQQPSQVVQFDGEETLAYEFGVKADLFDRKLRINATGFYTDYKTRITNVTGAEANLLTGTPVAGTCVLIPFPAGGTGATQCRTTPYNAATDGPVNLTTGVGVASIPRTYFVNTPGKAKGFELELEAHPVDGLLINGAVGYANFSSPDLKIAGRANDRVIGVPEWNANAGIQYTADVPALGGSITPRFDVFYTGNIANSAARNTYNQKAYAVSNVRVTYKNDKHLFSIAAGATNVFDKLYYLNYFVYQDIGYPTVNGQPSAPREWFVELTKKF